MPTRGKDPYLWVTAPEAEADELYVAAVSQLSQALRQFDADITG